MNVYEQKCVGYYTKNEGPIFRLIYCVNYEYKLLGSI